MLRIQNALHFVITQHVTASTYNVRIYILSYKAVDSHILTAAYSSHFPYCDTRYTQWAH